MKKYAILALSILSLLGATAQAKPKAGGPAIEVFKSPTCGCCKNWEKHLTGAGFKVKSSPQEDMAATKNKLGVPEKLRSCHTAKVGDYVIEGHVPAASIKKLLQEKPKGVIGLAVPGMPEGSPGMEGPHPEKYDVISFTREGESKVFDSY